VPPRSSNGRVNPPADDNQESHLQPPHPGDGHGQEQGLLPRQKGIWWFRPPETGSRVNAAPTIGSSGIVGVAGQGLDRHGSASGKGARGCHRQPSGRRPPVDRRKILGGGAETTVRPDLPSTRIRKARA